MPEIEWALTEDAPVKEKFGGTIKVRTLWQAPSGATAQVVEIDPGACWEGAFAIILPAVSFIIRKARHMSRSRKRAAPSLSFIRKVRSANGLY